MKFLKLLVIPLLCLQFSTVQALGGAVEGKIAYIALNSIGGSLIVHLENQPSPNNCSAGFLFKIYDTDKNYDEIVGFAMMAHARNIDITIHAGDECLSGGYSILGQIGVNPPP